MSLPPCTPQIVDFFAFSLKPVGTYIGTVMLPLMLGTLAVAVRARLQWCRQGRCSQLSSDGEPPAVHCVCECD